LLRKEFETKLEEKDKQLQDKDEQIAFLKTLLESKYTNLSKESKTINNNNNNITINNITTKDMAEFLEPIHFEEIKSAIQDLNYKHIRKGMKGIATSVEQRICKYFVSKKEHYYQRYDFHLFII